MVLLGDDSVFECVSNDDQVDVYLSYNSGRSNSRLDQPKFGLSDVTNSSKDGVITCNLKRTKVASSNTGRRKRAASNASTFFDLNSNFTLFYAIGSASSGILQKHSASPLVSNQIADFQSIQDIRGSSTGGNLVEAHDSEFDKVFHGSDASALSQNTITTSAIAILAFAFQ
ncbi:hypothetical protein DPMN_033915 [Dreissena polymorpha]|uniref:Uncharacterized protein n=1 Tax=Dreissena polymorpha TaxID=45954 RepID=A0A9D4M6N2_DREPO|nr:hypothetical protein DPMN_033915 [Dreissena polymorpha]